MPPRRTPKPAATAGAPVPEFPSIPDDAALAALRRRGVTLAPSDHWTDLWQEAHHRAFTVARSAGFAILGDIHGALERAMREGRTFAQFRAELEPVLRRKGWWGRETRVDPVTGRKQSVELGSPRRLRLLFDVNLRVSAAQGDWERHQSTKATRPWLRYTALLDARTRPEHAAWHGLILPVDHPWWKRHYPPNGWKCRCKAMSVGPDDLEAEGWTVAGAPPEGEDVPWVHPRTGEMRRVPRGIDPGWDYNPGNTDAAAHAANVMMEKVGRLHPPIASEALRAAGPLLPKRNRTELLRNAVARIVENGLAAWMRNPTVRPFPLVVLPREDAAAIGARVQVARLSAETFAKQQDHHPDLAPEDYMLAQRAVDEGERLPQTDRKIAYALNISGGRVVVVKATVKGDELYVVSLYRLSRNDEKREDTIMRLKREKK